MDMMMSACMMQSVKFWVSPILHQSKACIDGLDGHDLMRFNNIANLEEFI
jgi:hypothetical protein